MPAHARTCLAELRVHVCKALGSVLSQLIVKVMWWLIAFMST